MFFFPSCCTKHLLELSKLKYQYQLYVFSTYFSIAQFFLECSVLPDFSDVFLHILKNSFWDIKQFSKMSIKNKFILKNTFKNTFFFLHFNFFFKTRNSIPESKIQMLKNKCVWKYSFLDVKNKTSLQ